MDEILRGEADIAIIAMDDVLVKSHADPIREKERRGEKHGCDAVFRRKEN